MLRAGHGPVCTVYREECAALRLELMARHREDSQAIHAELVSRKEKELQEERSKWQAEVERLKESVSTAAVCVCVCVCVCCTTMLHFRDILHVSIRATCTAMGRHLTGLNVVSLMHCDHV